jgi:hypothetical protein
MRRAANFNPEWGYLAPAPTFMRSARLVLVATAVGASAGAAVVFSLVDRPVAEQSVAARTLVQTPLVPESAKVSAPVVAQLQTESQHAQPQTDAADAIRPSAAMVSPANAGAAGLAAGESGTTSTTQRAPGAMALAEAPAVTDAPPVPPAVSEATAAVPEAAPAPAQKTPNKKPRAAWRAAPRYDAPRYYMYAPRYYGGQPYDQRYVQTERNSFGW